MEPLFDGRIDLKPAVFLSRDVMAPAIPRSGLSAAGQEALAALMKVTSVNSLAAQKVIASLSASDQAMAMAHLIDGMRQADWSENVEGIHGAVVLAKTGTPLRDQLKAFVSGLPTQGMHRGIAFLLKKEGFLEATN